MMVFHLLNHITENKKKIFIFVVILIPAIFVPNIVIQRTEQSNLEEIFQYVITTVSSLALMIVFINLNRQNMVASLTSNLSTFEYEQYKDLFNTLQEGIVVIDFNQTKAALKDAYSVFFANEQMTRLLSKFLGGGRAAKKESIAKNLNRDLFYLFKIEGSQSPEEKFERSDDGSVDQQLRPFTLIQIMRLSQAQLSHMVFTFSRKGADEELASEIQKMLHSCKQYSSLELEKVPSYKFF